MIVQSLSDLPRFPDGAALICDTETSGLDPYKGDRIVGIVIGPVEGDAGWYLPIRHQTGNLPRENVCAWLRDLGKNPNRTWVFHNAKFDLKLLRRDGVEIEGPLWDTMVLAHDFRSDLPKYSLDFLTNWFLPGFKHVEYEKVMQYMTQTQPWASESATRRNHNAPFNYSLVPPEILGAYALEDLRATRLLFKELMMQPCHDGIPNGDRPSWGMADLIHDSMKLVKVLFEAEDLGIRCDLQRTGQLLQKAQDEMEMQKRTMWSMAGGNWYEPSQWKQFADAFERVGGTIQFWSLPEELRGKQKSQAYTTDREASTKRPCWNASALFNYFKQYQGTHEAAFSFLMAYHEFMLRQKTCSTYLEAFLQFADGANAIHGEFCQHGTVTGRLSCIHPNLQQLSKPGGTSDQKALEKLLGRKDEDALNRQVRSLFIARPGKVLVSIDYSSIEYRVAVFLAQDPHMLGLWNADPTVDYHQATVDLLQGAIGRDAAKIINFGCLYGMGAESLGAALTGMGVPTSRDQARLLLDRLFAARPSLRNLITQVGRDAQMNGFVQNVYGRRIRVPPDFSYKGLNYLDQSQAASVMTTALVRLAKLIKDRKLPVSILSTVHDEIVFEMEPRFVSEIAPILSAEMCCCPFMNLPLITDIEVGYRWSDGLTLDCYNGKHRWKEGRCEKCKKAA